MIKDGKMPLINDFHPILYKRSSSENYDFTFIGKEIETVCGELSGMSSDQLLNKYENIIHKDDVDKVLATISSASGSEKKYIIEYRIVTGKGHCKLVREYGTIHHHDKEIDIEGIILILDDKYRNLFEKVPVGLYVTNSMEQIVDMNAQLMNIIGIKRKENFAGKDIMNLYIEPSDRLAWQKQLETNGSVEYLESRWQGGDGRIIWVSENASLIDGQDGQQYCEVSVEDITTRKEAENALYKTYLQLEAANKKLNSRTLWMKALNALSFDLANQLDFDNTINVMQEHVSKNFDHLFICTLLLNWSQSNIRLKNFNCDDSRLLPCIDILSDSEFTINDKKKSIFLSGKSSAFLLPMEKITPDLTGPEFYDVLCQLKEKGLEAILWIPLASGSKQIGQLLIGFDKKHQLTENENYFITGMVDYVALSLENHNLYKQLKQSFENLQTAQESMKKQERLKAMGQVASGVTHDINNTLAPITLYTEALINNEPNLSERALRYLGVIQNAVADIENVTQRLRSFYKKDEELIPESIVISELFDELIDLTRPRWQTIPNKIGEVIRISKVYENQGCEVLGIRSDLREALVNCIFNAVDALSGGGEIKLIQKESDDYIIIEVEDDGAGMSDDHLQHCQDPFYTTKGASGTGLGLSEVFGMIQRHSGYIEIKSKLGEGTIVSLFFPKIEKQIISETEGPDETQLEPVRILCVDDDPVILDGLSEMLTIDGHHVETVESGKQALLLFNKRLNDNDGFQVVITDLGMPEMDGYNLAAHLKELKSEVPIILLTGWGQQILQNEIPPQNIDAVLSKPPRMKLLRAALYEQLRKEA